MPAPKARANSTPVRSIRMTTRRLGILGGTFDPVHIGHLVAAVNARAALHLDRVLLVVANRPWQKGDRRLTPAEDRLAMVEAAVAGRAGPGGQPGRDRPGRRHLHRRHPRAAGRRGPRWRALPHRRIRRRRRAPHLEAPRRRRPPRHPRRRRPTPSRRQPAPPAHRRPPARHADLGLHPRWRVERVDIPPLDISSSDLRERRRRGLPLDFLVPDPVIDLIRRRGLYAGDTMTTGSGGR